MISIPAGVRIYLACGVTDMRKGFDGLSVMAQDTLKENPFICGGTDYVAAMAQKPLGATKSAGWPPHNS